MTTSYKMIAAICLALVGGLVAEFVKPQLPEGSDPGHMTLVAAGVGIMVGWRVMARRAGHDGFIQLGIYGVAALCFWGLMMFGLIEMLRLAMARKFDEPVEALETVVTIAVDYGLYLTDTNVLITLGVGALISGILTNYAARNWG